MFSPWCQRTTPGRGQAWRHKDQGGFDADRYEVTALDDATAKAWIVGRHYSGTYPAAALRYGMWDITGPVPVLVGVAVLSVPASKRVLTGPFPRLVPYSESLELGRFCLAQEVPANGETWFLGRMLRLAAGDGVRGLVSFADPVPRPRPDGSLVFPGHLGIIYQAANFSYTGRATPRTLCLLPDGTVFSDRAASKIRSQDQGHRYAERLLTDLGAAPRRPDQPGAEWLKVALRQVGARSLRHGGNHRYVIRVGRSRGERTSVTVALPTRKYPKNTLVTAAA